MTKRKLYGIAYLVGIFITFLTTILITILITKKEEITKKEGPYETVSLRLNWLPDPTFTGPYVAKIKGFWEAKGIKVEIRQGGYQLDPIKLVASGSDLFGIIGADRLLFAVAKGIPIKAIAVEFKQNPVGWIVREDSQIYTPKDFENCKIAVKHGEESEVIFQALLKKNNVDVSKIKQIAVEFSLDLFLEGEVDAFPIYMNEEPHRIRDKGIAIRILNPAEFGIELYGNVVFTSEAMIKEHPDIVRKYIQGHLEGWEFTEKNPEEVAKLLEDNVPEMDKATIRRVLMSTLELLYPKGGLSESELGSMSQEGWLKTKHIAVTYGGLDPTLDVKKAYDQTFLKGEVE